MISGSGHGADADAAGCASESKGVSEINRTSWQTSVAEGINPPPPAAAKRVFRQPPPPPAPARHSKLHIGVKDECQKHMSADELPSKVLTLQFSKRRSKTRRLSWKWMWWSWKWLNCRASAVVRYSRYWERRQLCARVLLPEDVRTAGSMVAPARPEPRLGDLEASPYGESAAGHAIRNLRRTGRSNTVRSL